MYYTSNVAYKKTKITIDMISIGVAAAIVVLFLTVIFWKSMSSRLFPLLFVLGAVENALGSLKNFLNWNRKAGFFLLLVTILLIFFAALSWNVAARTF